MLTTLKVAIVGASIVLLAGCSFGSSTPSNSTTTNTANTVTPPVATPSGATVEVALSEYAFSPSNITLKANQSTTLTLSNTGRIAHTFVVAELNINQEVAAGKTETITVTPTKAGTFQLDCTVGGHKQLGMHGTVTVTE